LEQKLYKYLFSLSLSLSFFPLSQNWYSYQFTCLQVLEFLKSKENCISLLLKHLGTSAIMDLMLKLITHVEGVEMKQNILNVSINSSIQMELLFFISMRFTFHIHFP